MTVRIAVSRALLGATAVLALAGTAQASNIQYFVNITQGAASITGSITTDGTLGDIGAANLLDWNLSLNDGASSFTLTHGNSAVYVNSAFVASSHDLSFNYSSNHIALIQNPTVGSSHNYWCMDGSSAYCSGGPVSSNNWRLDGALISNGPYTGVHAIASVPEPTTYAMLGAGLGLLAFAARRKQQS